MKSATILACLLASAAAFGGDEAAHRSMTYGLAIAAGFSPDEAKIISDASWSQDQNQSTSALTDLAVEGVNLNLRGSYPNWANHVAKNPEYAQKLLKDDTAADQAIFDPKGAMARVGPSAIIHTLMAMSPAKNGAAGETRLDEAYQAYLRQQFDGFRKTSDPETARKAQLILVGQYSHVVIDTYVHPPSTLDPIVGHALSKVSPDLVYLQPEKMTKAATRALEVMTRLKQEVTSDGKRTGGIRLVTAQEREQFSRGLVEKVSAGYDSNRPRSPNSWQRVAADDASGKELEQIDANVGEYLSHTFQKQGVKTFVKVPEFDKVSFTVQDKQFKLEYKGKGFAKIDNVVTWVAGQEQFTDLKEPARQALRKHVDVITKVGDAAREVKNIDTPQGRQAIVKKLEVGGVNLHVALDVLETLDIFAVKSDNPVSVVQRPVLVSLRRLLEKPSQKLPIGRVHGFVQTDDDICLIGTRTEELIDVDSLAVAVKTVYKEGRAPGASLDPRPDDLGGPQYSRVIAVPPRSAFARVMLDADYDMKCIMLGQLPVKARRIGYRTYWDLALQDRKQRPADSSPVNSRFWLHPVELGPADIRVSGDGSVFIFSTRVQVLTEQMTLTDKALIGTGRANPVATEAAALFTANYADIAQEYPTYRRLHGLVDLVTVCAAWRRLAVNSPVLDKLAARAPAEVDVPVTYAGVSRSTWDGEVGVTLSGGVQARSRMLRDSLAIRDTVQTERLRAAARAVTDMATDLDGVLRIPLPLSDRQGEFERLLAQADRLLAEGKFDDAIRVIGEATKVGPQYPDTDILHARALAMQGKGAAAVAAAAAAVAKDPTDPDIARIAFAIRAKFGDGRMPDEDLGRSVSETLTGVGINLLIKGQAKEALENFQVALKAWPENPDALLGRGMAGVTLNQQDAALKDLLQARKLYRRTGDNSRYAVALATSAVARLGELERQQLAGQLRVNTAAEDLEKVADEAGQAMELAPKLELARYAHVQSRGVKVGVLQAAGVAVRWDAVQAAADEFVKTHADSALAWAAHATVHYFRNDPKTAAADLSKAIERNAASPALYRQRGVAWHKALDFDKAVADYKRALQLAPGEWPGAETARALLRLAQDKKPLP